MELQNNVDEVETEDEEDVDRQQQIVDEEEELNTCDVETEKK